MALSDPFKINDFLLIYIENVFKKDIPHEVVKDAEKIFKIKIFENSVSIFFKKIGWVDKKNAEGYFKDECRRYGLSFSNMTISVYSGLQTYLLEKSLQLPFPKELRQRKEMYQLLQEYFHRPKVKRLRIADYTEGGTMHSIEGSTTSVSASQPVNTALTMDSLDFTSGGKSSIMLDQISRDRVHTIEVNDAPCHEKTCDRCNVAMTFFAGMNGYPQFYMCNNVNCSGKCRVCRYPLVKGVDASNFICNNNYCPSGPNLSSRTTISSGMLSLSGMMS